MTTVTTPPKFYADSTMASAPTCKECKGFNLTPDTHGGLEILVCKDCGAYTEAQLGGDANEFCPSSKDIRSIADGPTQQGQFHGPKNYDRQRERILIKHITNMADAVRLPEHETELCIQECMAMLQDWKKGSNMKVFAAGLVFIALQRSSASVSLKEIEKLLNVKRKPLCRIVRKLKQSSQVSKPKVKVSDEDKIQAVVDRLPTDVTLEERVEVKKIAVELRKLCKNIKIQGKHVCFSSTADYALLVLALESMSKPESGDRKWIEILAKEANITESSLNTRLWRLKSILVQLAQQLPFLGSMVDSKEITTRNIQKYVSLIVDSKNFFLLDPDGPHSSDEDYDSNSEGTSSPDVSMDNYYSKESSSNVDDHHCHSAGSSTPNVVSKDFYYQVPSPDTDEEGNLSDLDPEIDEYIASSEVVEKKTKLYKDSKTKNKTSGHH